MYCFSETIIVYIMFLALNKANKKIWDIPILSYYMPIEIKIVSVEKDIGII